MENSSNIVIVILAAGASTRMGKHVKQALPWKGTTLLGNAIAQAETSIANATYVVLGANDEVVKAEVAIDGSNTIQNMDWKKGMGSSIATSILHFMAKGIDPDAVLIMLSDQPLIDTNYLNKMIGNWKGNPSKIISTKYEHRDGVPAIFGEEYFPALAKLNENVGAKEIISANIEQVTSLDPNGKEVDVDTWENYQELFKKYNK